MLLVCQDLLTDPNFPPQFSTSAGQSEDDGVRHSHSYLARPCAVEHVVRLIIIRRHFAISFLPHGEGKRFKGYMVLESRSLALERESAEH